MDRLKGLCMIASCALLATGCASTNPWLSNMFGADIESVDYDRSGFSEKNQRGYAPTQQSEFMPMSIGLRNHYRLQDDEMLGLQYYLSDTIVLRREDRSGTREVDRGRLVEDAGQLVDEVVVEAGTPGIAKHLPGGAIEVAFEEGDTLTFSPAYSSDLYHLTGDYDYWGDERAYVVEYRGGYYRAVGDSRHAHLLIDRQFRFEAADQSRYLPGRRLTGSNYSNSYGTENYWRDVPVTQRTNSSSSGNVRRPQGMRADPATNPYVKRWIENSEPVTPPKMRENTREYPGLPRHQDIYSQY